MIMDGYKACIVMTITTKHTLRYHLDHSGNKEWSNHFLLREGGMAECQFLYNWLLQVPFKLRQINPLTHVYTLLLCILGGMGSFTSHSRTTYCTWSKILIWCNSGFNGVTNEPFKINITKMYSTQACELLPMKKRGKENTGKTKKRGKNNIPILLYTESEEQKRKIRTKEEEISLKRNSHMPEYRRNKSAFISTSMSSHKQIFACDTFTLYGLCIHWTFYT